MAGIAQLEPILWKGVDFVPLAALIPCRYPGCTALLKRSGYCDVHRHLQHRDYGRARLAFDSERGFYQSERWRAVRAAFLREHPLCVQCHTVQRVVPAVVVDHICPLKAGGARFDWHNLQALCVSCHNRKTTKETNAQR